jgi:hypothetical protein
MSRVCRDTDCAFVCDTCTEQFHSSQQSLSRCTLLLLHTLLRHHRNHQHTNTHNHSHTVIFMFIFEKTKINIQTPASSTLPVATATIPTQSAYYPPLLRQATCVFTSCEPLVNTRAPIIRTRVAQNIDLILWVFLVWY